MLRATGMHDEDFKKPMVGVIKLDWTRLAEVDFAIEDFNEIQKRVPHLADLKPSGKYVFQDLYNVGRVPAVLKNTWLDNGLLHGDCLTVTGKTLAENLENVAPLAEGQDVIMSLENPKRKDGPLIVLKGNLAPDGAVVKVSGLKQRRHEGPAKVFNTEEAAIEATLNGEIVDGDVVVCPLCRAERVDRECRKCSPYQASFPEKAIKVCLITDGRFSGGSHGFVVGHIAPEAQDGGPIALLETDDTVTIDQDTRELTMKVSDEELAKRRKDWCCRL